MAKLLFRDKQWFESVFDEYRIVKREKVECLLFLLSGGVNFTVWHPNFSDKGCKVIRKIDNLLVRTFPEIFALGYRIVLEKKDLDNRDKKGI